MRRALALLLGTLAWAQAPAPKPRTDINALMLETMKIDMAGHNQTFVMWLPYDVFKAITAASGKVEDPAELEQGLAPLLDYQIFMVHRSSKQDDGSERILGKAELDAAVSLRDAAGRSFAPLKSEALPENAKALIEVFRKSVEQNSNGTAYTVEVFPAKDAQGKPLVSMTRPDRISMVLKASEGMSATTVTWRTPYTSLSSPRACAKCGESLLASWSFCPFCGAAAKVQ